MVRTIFLVDGFNLYHSVKLASHDLGGVGTRWLDIAALCRAHIPSVPGRATLVAVHYFSALATHFEDVKPDVTQRHRTLIRALEETDVEVSLGRFKPKDVRCPHCHPSFVRHEEKETDVAIGVRMMELFHADECDTVVIVSGDTDLVAAFVGARRAFPTKKVFFAFPYRRKTKELAKLAPGSFRFSSKSYVKHQFPSPITCADGTVLTKPAGW